tara:strand:- start:293 stop:442 length:150 start_codon:yes stop_codon:yes gene_type:complete
MAHGYHGKIEHEHVFVEAESISDAIDIMEKNSSGKKWEFYHAASIRILK